MNEFIASLNMPLVWFLIGFVLLLAEFVVPGLVIFFFGIGAWIVSLIGIFFDISLNLQLLIFLLSSMGLLLLLRNKFQSLFYGFVPHHQQENINEEADFIGETCTVIEPLKKNQLGKVEFHGTAWKAESEFEIAKGERVEIVSLNNITLIVKPL